MTAHDKAFHIEAILDHIAAIKSYAPATKEALVNDEKTCDAILMRLIAIGEDLTAIRDILEKEDSNTEWHKIIGLRNRIAHGYWEVDKDVIWELLIDGSLEALENALA